MLWRRGKAYSQDLRERVLAAADDGGSVCAIARRAGAKLMFIPPYSPDLNPIEQAFAKLKALLRARAIRTVDALWKALGNLVDYFSPEECASFLRHDGYFQSP